MNRSELVKFISENYTVNGRHISRKVARGYMDVIFDAIKRACLVSDRVDIPDFGCFRVKIIEPRTFYSAFLEKDVTSEVKVKVSFTPYSSFDELLQHGTYGSDDGSDQDEDE